MNVVAYLSDMEAWFTTVGGIYLFLGAFGFAYHMTQRISACKVMAEALVSAENRQWSTARDRILRAVHLDPRLKRNPDLQRFYDHILERMQHEGPIDIPARVREISTRPPTQMEKFSHLVVIAIAVAAIFGKVLTACRIFGK